MFYCSLRLLRFAAAAAAACFFGAQADRPHELEVRPHSFVQTSPSSQLQVGLDKLADSAFSQPQLSSATESSVHIKVASSVASGPVVPRLQREQALRDIIYVLNASGVEFVAAYGSALGLVREGRLLEIDDDVDFVVKPKDGAEGIVRKALMSIQAYAGAEVDDRGGGSIFKVGAATWGPVDIYLLKDVDPKQVQGRIESDFLCDPWNHYLVSSATVFPAKWMQPKGISGLMVPMPKMPERYVADRYGAEWRTPNPHSKGAFVGSSGAGQTEAYKKQYRRLCTKQTLVGMTPESAAKTGLMIPLIIAGWLAWKPGMAISWSAPLSLTVYELTIAGVYVVLSALVTLSVRQTHGSALQTTVEACFLLYVLKALVSIVFLAVKRSVTFTEVYNVLKQRKDGMYLPVWCNLAVVGILFASYDALLFVSVQNLPPWRLIGKKISLVQFSALMLIAFAACSLGSADMFAFSSINDSKSKHDYFIGIALVVCKILVSGLALVCNEVMLKELPLPVDAQNLITYSFSMVFLLVGMCMRSVISAESSSVETGMAMVLGQILSNTWMICAVLLLAALGIVCAYLLKAFSAMEKEFMSQAVVGLIAIGQSFLPGEHGITLLSVESGLIIVLACIAYRINDPPAKESPPECTPVAK